MSLLKMDKRDIPHLYLQILFVSHQHYWHLGGSTHHVHNLIIKYLDDLEAPEAVYGVDQDVAVDVNCVLGGEHAVLVLARCVHQEELKFWFLTLIVLVNVFSIVASYASTN